MDIGIESAMHGKKQSETGSCPFNPAFGGIPPYLAGREQEQCSIARDLDALKHGGAAPFAMIVYGPRGNGKAALLQWAQHLALEKGIESIRVASSMIETEDALVRELSARRWRNGIVKAASAFGLQLPVNGQRATTIREALEKRVRRRPLLLWIDEAHALDPDLGQNLLQSAQLVYGHGAQMLLMIVGSPDLISHLHEMRAGFWERSPILPLARLEAGASAEAVRIPLEAANRSISTEALEQVVRESHGYPFFLQLWGKVLWCGVETAERTIGMDDVNRVRPEFEKARDVFYGLRFDELRRKQLVAPAAALARAFGNREELTESEVDEVLETVLAGGNLPSGPGDIMELINKLHNLGYIWSPGGNLEDRYFAGIPSLMTYVARIASTKGATKRSLGHT